MATELHDLSIAEISGLIAARKLSPVELVEALIQACRAVRRPGARVHHPYLRSRSAAGEAGRGRDRGRQVPRRAAWHPVRAEGHLRHEGNPHLGHSRVFIDRIPAEDATTTTRLYEAGAVLFGKLATHEMAHAGPSFDLPWPPARNPWNLAHFTGGSSSGSGAALAAGMVPVALGSDNGGSIRGQGSLCGLVGFMPTFGLVSRAGVITKLVHVRPLRAAGAHRRGLRRDTGSAGRLRPEGRGEPQRQRVPPMCRDLHLDGTHFGPAVIP